MSAALSSQPAAPSTLAVSGLPPPTISLLDSMDGPLLLPSGFYSHGGKGKRDGRISELCSGGTELGVGSDFSAQV